MGRIARWIACCCRFVDRYEPPLLCVAGPLLIFPRGPLPLVGLVAILGLWVARWVARGRVTVSTPVDLPLLLLLAMAIQSLYPSTDLTLSMPKLYGIVLGVAVYYAVVNGIASPRGWWVALGLLMAAAVGIAAVGLVGTDWIHKLPGSAAFYKGLPRVITSVQSSFGTIAGIHPNEVGGTLAFLLPVPIGVILWSLRRRRQDVHKGGVRGTDPTPGPSPSRGGERDTPSPTAVGDTHSPSPTAVGDTHSPSPTAVGEGRGEGPLPGDQEFPLTPWTCPLAGPRLSLRERELGISHKETGLTSLSPLPVGEGPGVGSVPRLPVLSAVTLLLAAPVLGLTFSRSAFLGFGCAVVLLVGMRWRRVGYGFVALALVGAIGLAVVGPQRVYEGVVKVDERSRTGGSTLVSRQEVWNRASYMVQDFPFTGIGLNSFPKVLDALYPSFIAGPEAKIPHAHNIYLQTAVDLGLAGLMAFLGMWAILFWQAVRAYRSAEGAMRGAIAGLGAGCLAYLIYGVADAITLGAKPLFLLWMMVGLVVVANRLLATTTNEKNKKEVFGDTPVNVPSGTFTPARACTLDPPLDHTPNPAMGPTAPWTPALDHTPNPISLPSPRGGGAGGGVRPSHPKPRQAATPRSLPSRTLDPIPSTQRLGLAFRIAREVGVTLWMLYWSVAVLFAGMAYLVVGISISGWVP